MRSYKCTFFFFPIWTYSFCSPCFLCSCFWVPSAWMNNKFLKDTTACSLNLLLFKLLKNAASVNCMIQRGMCEQISGISSQARKCFPSLKIVIFINGHLLLKDSFFFSCGSCSVSGCTEWLHLTMAEQKRMTKDALKSSPTQCRHF